MPNWVSNTVTMERLCDCNVFDEDGEFDFNKIVPQPKNISECPSKYIIPELERKSVNIEILNDRPWFHWYDWRWENWGTKWGELMVPIKQIKTIYALKRLGARL